MQSKRNRNSSVEILIAEDSSTQAEQLKHTLEEHGYTVTVTANGRQALAAAHKRKPTLIVSDIVMPELDGYGLCKAVKSDDRLKDVPIVLLTTLADSLDVIRGLECGADNFIRKPYEGNYLLSRIDYLLMNMELRKSQKMQMGVEINLNGQRHFITAERQQILDLLISTYEQATHINKELKAREGELAHSNQVLNGLYRISEGLNHATSEREAAELALERALELPGIHAGWISLREGESGFRLAAARNLPPALEAPGALEGECLCRRRLLSGELDSATNIIECERLGKAKGDTRGLRYHAAIPLWIGDQTVGLMNLAGPQEGLFTDEDLMVLCGVGNQVAVALERARLHEHLEQLLETANRHAAEIEMLNRILRQRASELEAANRELESFSYSVSHDLRAPLRAIDGFSRILQEDHSEKLDDKGRRLLGVVRDNSRKMGELIDDLLEFSRLGRKALSFTRIDTGRLVGDVLQELGIAGGREGGVVIGTLPAARGDATLVKQAWMNLISNAVKFSGKREKPVVEVNGYENETECVYSVRDNGAGFDMRYYDKLFGVFQRLHSAAEFPGTGVGLAIVQRVITRHGGRVWAESKVGEGAAFYFSLPKERRDGSIQ